MPCGGRVSLIRMLSPCLSPQELERLALELREATQRVEREQQQAAGAAEELLTLTERLGEAERQLHRTRYPGSRPAPPDPFPPPPGAPVSSPPVAATGFQTVVGVRLRQRSKTRRHVSDERGRQ